VPEVETTVIVSGSEEFVAAAWRALDAMFDDELAFVEETTREIMGSRAYSGAYIWDGVTNLPNHKDLDPVHLAGVIIHEAVHHYDWQNCRPAGGVEAETRAINRMVEFYERHDRPELADHYGRMAGTHGVGYDPADYTNPECAGAQPA
jgi:hypothetical protein